MSDQTKEDVNEAKTPDGEGFTGRACSASLESRYAWCQSNLRNFETWGEEIAHADSLGYKLVPPEYYLPHWSTAMSMGSALPKIYVMRKDGPDELGTHMDCYAACLGYPVYFKPNDQEEQSQLGSRSATQGGK